LFCVPQAPAQSAVLIGVHLGAWQDDTGEHLPSYRTFLITFRDGKAQLAADIPDLIVPRKNGFWRVGGVHKGPVGGMYQELIYAAPVGSVPHAIGEYHPENPEWQCHETHQATIEFLNPDFVSVSYQTSPACSLETQFRHGTYKLDEPAKALEIAAIFGPDAWDAEKEADALANAHWDHPDCDGVSKVDSTNWGIERSSGLHGKEAKPWSLVGDFISPHVCGDGDTYEIEFPIPAAITGLTYHPDALPALLKSKLAQDNGIRPNGAFLTPSADFLVGFDAFANTELVRVFRMKDHALDPKPALSVFTNTNLGWEFNLVMIQWALGKHVAQWESDLKALAATPLPEPVVDIGKAEPY
jgi:hypothetical protein